MADVIEQAYVHAVRDAIKEEMRRDDKVIIWGQTVRLGGDMSTTNGIYGEFGDDRIFDTPINEIAMVDMAFGAALSGYRPIVNIMSASFVALAGDAILLKVGQMWKSFNHKGTVPLVIQTSLLQGVGMGPDHAWSTESLYMHSPHLKVLAPATPADAKGLMKSAIRDDFPVAFLAHRMIQYSKGMVPVDENVLVPIGKADVKRNGSDVTIVAYSNMVHKSLAAAEELAKDGIDIEVVDLRSLVPMDIETVVNSVDKTRRLLITQESYKRVGACCEIAFRFIEAAPNLVKDLKKPITRLGAPNVALPHGMNLENKFTPQIADVVAAVKDICA